VTRAWILAHNSSKYTLWRKEVPFWGPHDGRQHFGVQIPQKPSKMAFYTHVRASTNGFKTNDVIEDRRHWLRSVARSPSLAERRILYIASWYFPMITTQRLCQLMHSLYMGCSDVSEFEHIYGQIVMTPSCVYTMNITWTKMMDVNVLIVWKTLIDVCFSIKSSLWALTAAYTKF